MATAPKPGVGKRKAQTEAAKAMLVFTYAGEELSLAWQNLPMGERLACRKATGLAFERFTQQLTDNEASVIGEDSLCVMWWLARRAHGEAQLLFGVAVTEWDVTKIADVRSETPDPKGDDPEV